MKICVRWIKEKPKRIPWWIHFGFYDCMKPIWAMLKHFSYNAFIRGCYITKPVLIGNDIDNLALYDNNLAYCFSLDLCRNRTVSRACFFNASTLLAAAVVNFPCSLPLTCTNYIYFITNIKSPSLALLLSFWFICVR